VSLALADHQQELRGLAAQIFAGRSDPAHLSKIEATAEGIDRELWRELATAGLVGVAVPERHGGLGFGSLELCLVCEELGRAVTPVPLVSTATAAQLIAHAGTPAQQQHWLPRVAAGSAVIAVAPPQSVVEARRDGDRVAATVIGVPWAHVADLVLLPVDDVVLAIDPAAPGVTGTRVVTTARVPGLTLEIDASVEVIGPAGSAEWLQHRWLTALAAVQAGVTDAATRMAASYTSAREQFGKPLSTFQAVALKAADSYLDAIAIESCARQAAWTLDAGRDATLAVHTAAWWAAEGGQHCVHLTQHLHGGMGADITYPVHRYFLWGKQIELLVGGASALLAALGDALATRPAAGDAVDLG
jgi:3-oxocholest-4-en-26-oyl-CoA dehydrogenase beta subunit